MVTTRTLWPGHFDSESSKHTGHTLSHTLHIAEACGPRANSYQEKATKFKAVYIVHGTPQIVLLVLILSTEASPASFCRRSPPKLELYCIVVSMT
jgi:hypothetical protein